MIYFTMKIIPPAPFVDEARKRCPRASGFTDRRSAPGIFFSAMKHRRQREYRRELEAERRRAVKKAARAREAHKLCACSDDERFFMSEAEAAADSAPARICDRCLRKKLIAKIIMVNLPATPAAVELGKIGARGCLKRGASDG